LPGPYAVESGVNPRRVRSVLFGIASAIVVGLIGPLYATPILILSFALVFRTTARVSAESLLAAFAVAWFTVMVISPPLISNTPDSLPFWVGIGIVGMVLAAGFALTARPRRG